MKPVDPKVEGVPTVNYAEHQDEYETLPAAMMDPAQGQLYTKWEPTEAERTALAAVAVLILVINLVLTLLYMRLNREKVAEQKR